MDAKDLDIIREYIKTGKGVDGWTAIAMLQHIEYQAAEIERLRGALENIIDASARGRTRGEMSGIASKALKGGTP